MMPGELILCPFERRVVGERGEILVRHNAAHTEASVKAIRRRAAPAWSLQSATYRVEGQACAA